MPIVSEKIEYDDQRWHVWFTLQTEMKKFIWESTMGSDWQLFGGTGKFHGQWLAFLEGQNRLDVREGLPSKIKEFLEEDI